MQAKQPYVGLTLLDERGSSARTKYSAKRGLAVVDMMTSADLIRSRLSNISLCSVVRQSAVFPFIEPFPASPLAGTEVDRVALLIFSTAQPGQYASITVPGIREQHILATGPNAGLVLDTDAPSVVAFVDAVTSGLYCNPFGYDIIELAATIVERRL